MSEAKEPQAQYIRRMREAAVQAGKCYVCRSRPHRPGLRTCVECGTPSAAKKAHIAAGRCRCGREPRPGRKTCAACGRATPEAAELQVEYRNRRAAEGRCRYGACSVPPAPGRSSCPAHLELAKSRSAASKRKRDITKPKASPAALALAQMRKGSR